MDKKDNKVVMKSEENKKKITKDMNFSEVMKANPESARMLFEMGMGCMGCPMAMSETLEQGAQAHGIDVKELLKKLNKK